MAALSSLTTAFLEPSVDWTGGFAVWRDSGVCNKEQKAGDMPAFCWKANRSMVLADRVELFLRRIADLAVLVQLRGDIATHQADIEGGGTALRL